MEVFALAKNVRVSPRKVRLVAAKFKGMKAVEALERLSFVVKSSARPLAKVIQSALANGGKDGDWTIKNILVNEGLKMKRRDTSHGARYDGGIRIKRTAHIKVVLEKPDIAAV